MVVVSEGTSSAASALCPVGYQLLSQDLCARTKHRGAYVYLCYKQTSVAAESIGDILLVWSNDRIVNTSFTKSHNGQRASYTLCPTDLNTGAHGRYVYVCFSKSVPPGKKPITEINATPSGDIPPRLANDWEYACWEGTSQPADCNKGAGGPFIYISFKRG
jgi:hypothetical protein